MTFRPQYDIAGSYLFEADSNSAGPSLEFEGSLSRYFDSIFSQLNLAHAYSTDMRLTVILSFQLGYRFVLKIICFLQCLFLKCCMRFV
jgi:hypothetical protein